MSCQEIRDVMESYVRGTLQVPVQFAIRAHLERCEPCRREIEWLAPTVRAVGKAVRPATDTSRARLVDLETLADLVIERAHAEERESGRRSPPGPA